MKKHTILTYILPLALVACTGVNPVDRGPAEEGVENCIVNARIAGSPVLKTGMGTLDEGRYPVLWSENDRIGLISGDGLSTFTIKDGAGTTVATFGGDASRVVGAYPGTKVYPAAYPASDAFARTDNDEIWVGSELPAMQVYKAGSFSDNVYPMAAATADPSDYDFYNLTGIVQLSLKLAPAPPVPGADPEEAEAPVRIRQITFRGNADEKVAGGVAMKFDAVTGAVVESTRPEDNGRAVTTAYGRSYSTVIIDFSGLPDGGLALGEEETPVNIAVLPQTFENGFTVEIQDATNLGMSKYVAQDGITVKRSELKRMETITYLKPEALTIANSYLVTEPGEHMFPAYAYGNRMDIRIFPEGYDQSDLDAAILWTDIVDESGNMKADALTDLQYIKFQDGINYMKFKAGDYKGNVIIAVYDTQTMKIFWTWHTWFTDQPRNVVTGGSCASGSYQGFYPDGTPLSYEAESAGGNLVIMDRNLGAIHATPDECDKDASGNPMLWQTYGLYYQDGRKDPFIGGSVNGGYSYVDEYSRITYSDEETVKQPYVFDDAPFGSATTTTWVNPAFKQPWRYYTGFITLSQSINNPTEFSCAYTSTTKNPQWTDYTDPDNKEWMDPSVSTTASHGRTGLTFGGHEAYWNRTKTIMDPCPTGYSVLGERGGKFFDKDKRTWVNTDEDGYGLWTSHEYDGVTYNTWWPAAGVRARDGRMAGMGEYGAYFFYDHIKEKHGGHGFTFRIAATNSGFLESGGGPITGHATPIRCVRDKQLSVPVNPEPLSEAE